MTWQPPIPAGALYSKPARDLGPALALLAYCYDLVQQDGWFHLVLKEAAGDMGEPYPNVKRWWAALRAGGFFAEVTDRGKLGWHVRFKDVWLDWRTLESRPIKDKSSTNERSQMIPHSGEVQIKDKSSTNERSQMIPEGSACKVLHDDQESVSVRGMTEAALTPQPRTHPACQVYQELTGRVPNEDQAEMISEQVTDLKLWRQKIKKWLSHNYRADNVFGMLEWYNGKGQERINGTSNGRSPPSVRPLLPAEPRRRPADALSPDEVARRLKEHLQ